MPKCVSGWDFTPDPAGGAHDRRSPDSLVGRGGDTPPHTPPHSARSAARVGGIALPNIFYLKPRLHPTLSGREVSTGQSAVMLCGWRIKEGVTFFPSVDERVGIRQHCVIDLRLQRCTSR